MCEMFVRSVVGRAPAQAAAGMLQCCSGLLHVGQSFCSMHQRWSWCRLCQSVASTGDVSTNKRRGCGGHPRTLEMHPMSNDCGLGSLITQPGTSRQHTNQRAGRGQSEALGEPTRDLRRLIRGEERET